MINFFKNFITAFILVTSFVVHAQDTIFLKDTVKVLDTLASEKKPVVKQELVNESTSGEIIQDSIRSQGIQKTDYVSEQNSVPNESSDLSSVKIDADFENGLSDHPTLAQLDDRWKQELFSNNNLYDSLYHVIQKQDYSKIEYIADLPTDTLKARLKDLNSRTPFNVEYNSELESVIKSYLKRRHQSLTRLMALSDYYFPLFEQVLDNYDLPLEIKYLAIVESALRPRAKSRVGATGLWQFMYGTGKDFKLDVNSYVDERMDPIKATEASAKYLSKLYEIFGDWDLALASYNSGPGNVTKAIRRSGGYKNYWNLRPFLPRETAGYLPAFLATMYIFEYADKHDFTPVRPEYTYFETDTVRVKRAISLDQVSEVMKIDTEVLQFLNPSYKLDVIPFVKNENYTLRLPLDKVGTFVTHEEAIYAKAKAEFDKKEKTLPQLSKESNKVRYRVRSGDYLGLIARKFGVRVSQIKQWNGLRNNNLSIGKTLTIYPRSSRGRTKSKSKPVVPKVAAGKSAQKHPGVSVANLKEWNSISSSRLKPGMVLQIEK